VIGSPTDPLQCATPLRSRRFTVPIEYALFPSAAVEELIDSITIKEIQTP